jgi:hypothetical protein
MASSKSNNLPDFISKEQAAELCEVEPKSIGHIEATRASGESFCPHTVPGLYRTSEIIELRDLRAQAKAEKEQAKKEQQEKAEKEAQAKTEPISEAQVQEAVQRHEPAKVISEAEQALKEAVEAGETS